MALTLLTKFRHQLLPLKDEEYLRWFRENHKGYDPHHIMGSTFGMKFTDYLLVPATREMHHKWQMDLPRYFPLFIQPALENLLKYADEQNLFKFKHERAHYRDSWENPKELNMLLLLVHNNKGRRYATGKPKES